MRGTSFRTKRPAIRKSGTEEMLDRTLETAALIERNGIDVQTITCGGTGTYNISGVYPGVTEHQSGSYVYMDPGYIEKIPAFGLAFSILTTVLSRPTAEKIITDAGVQSLANDYGIPLVRDHPELSYLYLSEEHGSFRAGDASLISRSAISFRSIPVTAARRRISTTRFSPFATGWLKRSGRLPRAESLNRDLEFSERSLR